MAYRDSTTNSGTSATPSTAVPAGVVSGDIVILAASIDGTSPTFETADWPSGFTALYASTNTGPDGHKHAIGWKRLTGSDSGSYTFGNLGASGDWVCQAFAFSGRHTTDPPVATENINNSSNSSPITVTATGVTAVAGDDLLWVVAADIANAANKLDGFAPPSSPLFNEQEETGFGWSAMSGATRENVNAGATGDISGTLTTLDLAPAGWTAYLVRIPAAGGATPIEKQLSESLIYG